MAVGRSSERAQFRAQIIQFFDALVFRQAKIFQVHPVTGPPKDYVCFDALPVFENHLLEKCCKSMEFAVGLPGFIRLMLPVG